jgi:hypothetical protein
MHNTANNITADPAGLDIARAVLAGVALVVAPVSSSATPSAPPVAVRQIIAEPNVSRRAGKRDVETARYFEVLRALEKLASLDPEDEYHLTPKARCDGEHLLNLLNTWGTTAPRVFSDDPDSVVFSWDRAAGKMFLTLSDGVASLLRASPEQKKVLASASLKGADMIKLLSQATDDANRFTDTTAE